MAVGARMVLNVNTYLRPRKEINYGLVVNKEGVQTARFEGSDVALVDAEDAVDRGG